MTLSTTTLEPSAMADPGDAPGPGPRPELVPTSVVVTSSLSEDTVWVDAQDYVPGESAMSLFANPFAGGQEELLYVDGKGVLQWATHSNERATGWTRTAVTGSAVTGSAVEVLTVVHPSGVVFAFVTIEADTKPTTWQLARYYLGRDANGGVRWIPAAGGATGYQQRLSRLQVQYSVDRPSVPVLFFQEHTDQDWPIMHALTPDLSNDGAGPEASFWWAEAFRVPWPVVVSGADEVLFALNGQLGAYTEAVMWLRGSDFRVQEYTSTLGPNPEIGHRTLTPHIVTDLVGTYVTPVGVSLVMIDGSSFGCTLWVAARDAWGGVTASYRLDVENGFRSARLVQDDRGLMSIILHSGGNLAVFRQSDYLIPVGHDCWLPSFTTVTGLGGPEVVSTVMAPAVFSFIVDNHPDAFPSQFICGTAKSGADIPWLISTQDVNSSWWNREEVRFSRKPQARTVTRYAAQVTLKADGGAGVPMYPVQLSATQNLEVEVLGVVYRLGPTVPPVALETDFRGCVTVKIPATSLAGAEVIVSARGLPQAVAVNPAAGVHRYLGGTGTLPNRPLGFTAEELLTAQTSTGDWVFKAFHPATDGDGDAQVGAPPEPPTPADIVTACASLMTAPGAGTARSFSLQTWDSDRPAFEVLVGDESLPARDHVASHPSFAGFLDATQVMVGDLWAAIEAGAVTVLQVTKDAVRGSGLILLQWWDAATYAFEFVWQSTLDAVRAVEAVLSSVKARISDVIDWLTWALDLKDVFETKDAMLAMGRQLPQVVLDNVAPLLAGCAAGWFTSKKELVEQYLDLLIRMLEDQSAEPPPPPAAAESPNSLLGGQDPSGGSSTIDPLLFSHPHVTWWLDQLMSLPYSVPTKPSADGQIDEVGAPDPPWVTPMAAVIQHLFSVFDDSPKGQQLQGALDDLLAFVWNVFDAEDWQAFSKTAIVRILSFARHMVLVILEICEAAVKDFGSILAEAVEAVASIFDLPVELDQWGWLAALWSYLCSLGGRPDEPLTVANFYGVLALYPVTTLFKVIRGVPPFPGGTHPDLLPGRSARDDADPIPWMPDDVDVREDKDYYVPATWQLIVQLITSIGQCANLVSDSYLTVASSSHDASHDLEQLPWNRPLMISIAVGDFFIFCIGDMPYFYGYGRNPTKYEPIWWGEYVPKNFLYVFDLLFVFFGDKLLSGGEASRKLCALLHGTAAYLYMFLAGVVENGCSIAVYAASDRNPNDYFWLWTQMVSNVTGVLAAVRIEINKMSLMHFSALNYSFIALGVVTNLTAGLAELVEASRSMDQHIDLRPDRMIVGTLPDAVVGARYVDAKGNDPLLVLEPLSGFGSWTPLAWAVVGDFPLGLMATPAGPNNTILQFSGKTDVLPADYTFQIWAANCYDPNIIMQRDFTITVKNASQRPLLTDTTNDEGVQE